mgnify:CR=1 FL=1
MNTTEPFRPEERQTAEAPLLTGSQALIESFLREGVETVFGYPGGATTATACATSSCATSRAPSTPRRAMPA